jgi:hypothetical protein
MTKRSVFPGTKILYQGMGDSTGTNYCDAHRGALVSMWFGHATLFFFLGVAQAFLCM